MAQEVLQTSYLKILERQNLFGARSGFKTWAFVIVKNTAIDAFRKKRREISLIKTENHLPDHYYDDGIENEYEPNDGIPFFDEALGRLSERQRQLLQLVFYHDLSLNQSAKILNISPGTVRKHYDRAKKILAEWFLKKGIVKL
jgi:RNA polymerase sigma-70 factor (ECF subfamily)